MKKLFTFCLYFLAFNTYAQNLPNHPRVLLLANEESGIQKNIEQDKNWALIHQNILDEATEIISLPTLERIQVGRRLLDKSREALRRLFILSYAYRMTNEKKYFDRCEAELLKISQFTDWNPSHFLDVAEMTMAVSIGYDWLHKDLSETSRKQIKEAILQKGLLPSMDAKHNSWLKASHNWNQVCNAGMTYGALATFEDNPTLAMQIINRAKKSIELPLEDYNPDGAYPEGFGYWGYGTSFHVLFLSVLQKLSLLDNAVNEGFNKTAYYYQQMLGSSGQSFNYSDAGSGRGGLSPAMFWYANKLKDNSLLFNEKKYLNDKKMVNNRILPAVMIWGNGLSLDNVPNPNSHVFVGAGKSPVAMMRTSWTDADAIYLGLKAGSANVNHAHMDIGSFVVDALGERWALDLGMQSYESLESKGVGLWNKTQDGQRWEILRYNNRYHNTLTFDDELQLVQENAEITQSTTSPNFMSAVTDLSNIYKNKVKDAKRGVAIMDKNLVVIRDEITNNEVSTRMQWTMVTPADVKILDYNTVELTQNGKKMYMQVVSKNKISLKTWSTDPVNSFDESNPGTIRVGFEVNLAANEKSDFTVFLSPAKKTIKVKPLKSWK
ncbi:Heparinase II/III-like [Spirosomataceae bacterium]